MSVTPPEILFLIHGKDYESINGEMMKNISLLPDPTPIEENCVIPPGRARGSRVDWFIILQYRYLIYA